VKVIELDVLNNKKDRKKFVNLPWDLYKDIPSWVPPLKIAVSEMLMPKHPFYAKGSLKAWMIEKDGKLIGRIAAILNPAHNEFHDENCGFYGFFEAIDDKEVFKVLFDTAQAWLKEQGMSEMRGPMNLSTNYECGTLVDGFQDPPQIMMLYNQEYHDKNKQELGLTKEMDLIAYNIDAEFEMPSIFKRISARMEKSNRITYRTINKKNWANEVKLMFEIYNSAWEKNWGFVPMGWDEFNATAKELKQVVDENLILFAEVNGEAAGFIVALPDFHQVFARIPDGKLLPFGIFKLLTGEKHVNRVRVITMGIKEEYRKLGLASLLYYKTHENIKNVGKYKEIEMSWILENNKDMNKPLITMGADPYKKYRIYSKSL
jgi:hypothetical protein